MRSEFLTLFSVAAAQDIFVSDICSGNFDSDTDYHNGQGLGHADASSVNDCCTQCSEFSGCKYFTFADGVCWFKDNNGGKRGKKGAISGGLGTAPTPAPAPHPTPAPVPTPTPSGHLAELTRAYEATRTKACGQVNKSLPELPSGDLSAFMAQYHSYQGDETEGAETPVLESAKPLLSHIDNYLSLGDSFDSGGLDSAMVQCAVLSEATAEGLATFAVRGQQQEEQVAQLLSDSLLMRDMLVAGGAKGGKYGEAMAIYTEILQESVVLRNSKPPSKMTAFLHADKLWDDQSQGTVLHRLALGTALEHADPFKHKYVDSDTNVDPIQRYLHYEKAYLAGDLDSAFEVLTTFELRFVSDTDAIDEDMTWMRETLSNLRPDYIAKGDMHWRYANAVHEVSYGHTTWPDGYAPDYKYLPAANAVCGGRAWWTRLARKSFGMPTWGVQQPGHAAMTTWAPNGWEVLLGAAWKFSYWAHAELDANRGGPDFHLETQCREHRADFQKVLRMQWAATALQEEPVNSRWTPTNAGTYGKGGPWSALSLYLKKVTMSEKGPATRDIPLPLVPTKVDQFLKRWSEKLSDLPISTGSDGTITIPASAISAKNHSVTPMWSFDAGQQLLHSGGSVTDPDSVGFEYQVAIEDEGSYFLTANISTWHMNTDLVLHTSSSAEQMQVPVFFTVGHWSETTPIEINLHKGMNTLRFTRLSEHALAIKEFFLFKTKPFIPTPDPHATPAPTPPLSDYIELGKGLTCVSQGIQDLDEGECKVACEYLGFKYSGSRQRPWLSKGCFALGPESEWAGNCNYNSNSSSDYDPTIRAVCLRL